MGDKASAKIKLGGSVGGGGGDNASADYMNFGGGGGGGDGSSDGGGGGDPYDQIGRTQVGTGFDNSVGAVQASYNYNVVRSLLTTD